MGTEDDKVTARNMYKYKERLRLYKRLYCKLDAKSKTCPRLGYGTERKGYRLYDSRLERVYYSRDVVFGESSRCIEKEWSPRKKQ